jgi:hypothetical protein
LSSRAKVLFDEMDASGSGRVSKQELFTKLKADAEVESLLGMEDVSGKGMMGAVKMESVLKKIDTDGDGSISWLEFEAAAKAENSVAVVPSGDKPITPVNVVEPAPVKAPAIPLDPKKKALLIAMDYYNAPAGWKPISGTVNDVAVFSEMLTNTWGFDPANQTIISDRTQQTTSALTQAIDDFTAKLEPGDIVALFYSGHGDRVFDEDGDEVTREGNDVTDTFDEAICTTDGHLLDDDIDVKLDGMLGKGIDHIFWFIDACYSGGFVERGKPKSVVFTSSTDKEKSEDALRIETDAAFYQGTGMRWLTAVMAELRSNGGPAATTTYQQLFDAIRGQRDRDKRKKVQHPTIVASEEMRRRIVLVPSTADS